MVPGNLDLGVFSHLQGHGLLADVRHRPPDPPARHHLVSLLELADQGLMLFALLLLRPVNHKVKDDDDRSEEHTSELQSLAYLVCRLLLEKKKKKYTIINTNLKNKTGCLTSKS